MENINNATDSHIEKLVEITRKTKDLDVTLFKDLIKRFFEKANEGNQPSEQLINLFLQFPPKDATKTFYYDHAENRFFEKANGNSQPAIQLRDLFLQFPPAITTKTCDYDHAEKSIKKRGKSHETLKEIKVIDGITYHRDGRPYQEGKLYGIIARIAEIIEETGDKKAGDGDIKEIEGFFTDVNKEQFREIVIEILQHPEKNIESLKEFHTELKYEIAYHFIKSFLNGEYLIFDCYSEKLQEIENNILKFHENSNVPAYTRHPLSYELLTLIMISLSRANEACKYIRSFIEKEVNKQTVYTGGEDRARIKLAGLSDKIYLANDEECKSIKNIIKGVIDMTVIDHCFYANNENVRKIHALYTGTKTFQEKEETQKKISISSYYNEFISAIKQVNAKTWKMFDDIKAANKDKYNVGEYDLVYEQDWEKLHFSTSTNYGIPKNMDGYIYSRKIKEGYQTILFHDDLTKYNQFVCKGVKIYEDLRPFFKDGKTIGAIQEFIKKKKDEIKYYPTFYLQAIELVSNEIEEGIKFIKKEGKDKEIYNQILILKQLLAELYKFIQDYATCPPPTYRPIFQDSFYIFEETEKKEINIKHAERKDVHQYDLSTFKTHFFYASCDCKPINLHYLRSFYEKYKLKRKILSDKYYNYINEKQESLIGKTEKIAEDTSKQEKKLITTLGIFAAFLTFASGSISFLKEIGSIYDFIVYCLTFTLALSVFANILHDKFAKDNKTEGKSTDRKEGNPTEKEKWWKFIFKLQFILFVLWVVALIFRFCVGDMPFIQREDSAETQKVDINLSIQKTLQDILHKRSDTIHISSDQLPKQNTYNMNHKDTTNK